MDEAMRCQESSHGKIGADDAAIHRATPLFIEKTEQATET
jgi:hypothetical protein